MARHREEGPAAPENRLILETLDPRIDGTVDDASRIEGLVVVESEAEIVSSTVRGPAIIGRRTRIENSSIGPFTSIAAECAVVD